MHQLGAAIFAGMVADFAGNFCRSVGMGVVRVLGIQGLRIGRVGMIVANI